jgi:hypothetical protein
MMFCFSHALATAICLHTSFASPLVKPDNATMQYGFANVGRTIYMCRYYLNVAVDCESRSCVDALLPEPVSTSCFPPLCFAEVRSTCALLQVPLDYTNVSVGATNIAIIKRPGETPDAQEVLVNPGGPGGSSVDMVLGDCASMGPSMHWSALIHVESRIVVRLATALLVTPTSRVTPISWMSSDQPTFPMSMN